MTTLASERTEDKPKRSKSRAALAFLFVLCAAASAFAQTTATVAGRVTDGDRGVPGVVVTLAPSDSPMRARAGTRAKTDAEGKYRITNVPPGRYQVMPFAPAYVVEGMTENMYPPGKSLLLSPGDVVEDVDFRIERGGVITGRITDAEGNPLVGQYVTITTADPKTGRRAVGVGPMADTRAHQTDDRGVYRIYGLPAGRYHVSAGSDTDNGAISYGRRRLYQRTFYPGATEESQAQVVEVSAGGEAENVDIRLGEPVKTYRASGRFVDAATGQPVPNVAFAYGTVDPTGQHITSFGGGMATDANGEFVADGLTPGHYAAFAYPYPSPQGVSDLYSDPAIFDIVDSDVKGVVVKVKHGSTVTGVVAVEGAGDAASVARLAGRVQVFARYAETGGTPSALALPGYVSPTPAAPDGSFRITGLRPGKIQLAVSGQQGLTLSRVEMNGAVVTGGIDVAEGAQVSGVRIVVAYGNAVIRGQVNYVNGTLPQDARITAVAQRLGSDPGTGARGAQVDSRGHFRIEGLAAGEYEVSVFAFSMTARRPFRSDKQHASLASGGDATVTITLDLSAQPGGVKP